MTAALLELTELAAQSGVPAPRVRHYAEAGLLPPARSDGDRLGYPAAEAGTVRMLAGAEDLGLDTDALFTLAAARRDGDCTATHSHLAAAIGARLDQVQAAIADHNRQAAAAGPGTPGWATQLSGSLPLSEEAARLQAVAAALTATTHDGPCGQTCACTTALDAAGTTYHFPHDAGSSEAPLACDLAADAGDMHHRVGGWQQVLNRVQARTALPDTATGVALGFGSDVDLAATLARLAASEYRCCSFGSYTLVIDGDGLRLEIRMPDDAAGMLAAVVGRPDTPANKETDSATHQP
jgi:DNA-binding transcriptional MerR regulator